MTVLLEASSLANPLAEAWRSAFETAGVATIGVLTKGRIDSPIRGWTSLDAVEGWEPETVVSWWGLSMGRDSRLSRMFPQARHAVIVDTFPNASRGLTELREWLRNLRPPRRPDVLVTYSDEMTANLRRRRLLDQRTTVVSLLQPYPLSMHRDTRLGTGSPSVIFTGRADLLMSDNPRMAKDRLGPLLSAFRETGLRVVVCQPDDEVLADYLANLGFEFYPRLTNEQVLVGALAEEIAGHSLHYCGYHVANRTIRRRVAQGLSSRFSLGVTANTPILVPMEAVSSRRFLLEHGIGSGVSGPMDVEAVLARGHDMREAWRQRHEQWSAEGKAAVLHAILGRS